MHDVLESFCAIYCFRGNHIKGAFSLVYTVSVTSLSVSDHGTRVVSLRCCPRPGITLRVSLRGTMLSGSWRRGTWSRGPDWAVLWFWRLSMITRTVPPTAVWSPYTRASALCCWRRPMRTGGRRGGSGSEPRPNPYMCRRRTSLSYRSASSAPRWPPANQRPRPSRWSHEVLSHPACKRTAQVSLIVPFMFGGGFTVLHLRVSSITILSLITRNGQCTLRPKSCFSYSSSFPIKTHATDAKTHTIEPGLNFPR